jgi:hypothetical protein
LERSRDKSLPASAGNLPYPIVLWMGPSKKFKEKRRMK